MKPNKLKENMRRFGTKNLNKLTEQSSNDQQKIASILKAWDWDVTIGKYGISGSNNKLPSFGVSTDNSHEGGNCIMFEVYKEFYFDPIHICYKDDAQFERDLTSASKQMFVAASKYYINKSMKNK
tara:strand:- start:42 stop:416 length:375 start_codon:yes stop_codon:yes gene_type:complete